MDMDKIKRFLQLMGFQKISKDVYRKVYEKHDSYVIEVNLKTKEINYNGIEVEGERVKPQGKILIGEKTTSNLSQPENLVVLECVNRLLEKGYKPEHIHLEKKWTLGRTAKGGRADIVVYDRKTDDEGYLVPLMIFECKTWGTEFEKEKKRLKENGGQLFSYFQQERKVKYLVLYTSDLFETEDGEFIDYDNVIIKVIDNPEKVKECQEENKNRKIKRPCSYQEAGNREELHEIWKKLYRAYWSRYGIFEPEAIPYDIELKPLKKGDLVDLNNAQGLFNKFAEILRHNNISDNANAFNKMLNLILCKLVDEEEKSDNEELDFQVKGDEEYERLVDRLQRLYKEGMTRYLNIHDFVYHSDEEVENLIKVYPERANLEEVLRLFKEIKYYTNNEFAFKEVHNKKLFEENAEILIEVIELIQNYRFRNSKNYHILGDFFELLLDFGVKQSEGQFFTPIPIVQFINGSLNIKEIVKFKLGHEKYKYAPLPKFLDYACGAGHFLTDMIEKIRELTKEFPELQQFVRENPRWERDFIFGIEKDYRLARTAKIACFLANDGDANVLYGDGLENHPELEIEKEKFDVIATNPPYSIRKFKRYLNVSTEFELLKYLSEDAKEIEVLFIERAKQVLKEKTGRVGIILPSSILSNSGIYEKAREIILKHFEVKGIVEIGSNAFIATGTNTVILFLKRRDDKFVKDRERIAEEVFSGTYFEDERTKRDYIDALKLLDMFISFRGLPKDDYLKFIRENVVTEKLSEVELFRDYRKWFEGLSDIRNLKKKKKFKKLPEEEKSKILEEEFIKRIKEKEKEKFFYFLLMFLEGNEANDEKFYTLQRVFVAKAPDNKEEQKKFLGYEFSKRRGYEGIVIFRDEKGKMTTKLYDPDNYDNPEKVSAYIRASFDDEYIEVNEEIKPYGRWAYLPELIDWNKVDFDKAINLEGYKKIFVKSKWSLVKLGDICDLIQGVVFDKKDKATEETDLKVLTASHIDLDEGKVRVESPIYLRPDLKIDEAKKLRKGDIFVCTSSGSLKHLGKFAYVDSDMDYYAGGFCAIIRPKDEKVLIPKYLASFMRYTDYYRNFVDRFKGSNINNLKLSDLEKFPIPLPPLDVQKEIVEEMERIEKEQEEKRIRMNELQKKIYKIIEECKNQPWELLKLEDVLSLEYGKSLPKRNRRKGKYLVVGSNGIDGYHDEYLVEAPCVIIGRKGSAGKVNIYYENCYPIDTTYYVKTNQNIKFIYYLLKSLEPELEKLAKGTGVPGLNREDVYKIKIPLPPLEIQKEIVQKIETLEEEISRLKEEIAKLEEEKTKVMEKYL